tara:strand:+ start:9787 stop:9954 length:168 start_codon:yes stop_codon:yes gene_type:complete
MNNIITSILITLFVISLLGGIIEVAYNIAYKKPSAAYNWVVPALFAGAIWFSIHM